MEVYYKPQVLKQLEKLPKKERSKVIGKLEFLGQNPLTGKLLRGEFKSLRSLRVWPYRIIYNLQKEKIIILSIAHRQGVYNIG